jgi:NAD(P)-dependent dehydrogenase (short-subunit alcohol dehydrogenase family)
MSSSGKTAIVIGSTGGGAGRSIALTLARDGFNIVINNRSDVESARMAAELVEQFETEVCVIHADATKSEEMRKLVGGSLRRFGQIDVLIISPGGPWDTKDLPDIEPSTIEETLKDEISMVFICLKHVLPVMRSQKSGRVIIIGLEMADLPHVPEWAPYDYTLGKSARVFLARAVAERELKNGITVNAVCPTAFEHVEPEVALDLVRHGESWNSRKGCTPQDIAEAVSFLASEHGRFVTGSLLHVRFQA